MNFRKQVIGITLALSMVFSGFSEGQTKVQAKPERVASTKKEKLPSLSKSVESLRIGGSRKIKIKNLKKGMKVTYKSSDTKAVKVSKSGKMTALKPGKADISVKIITALKPGKADISVKIITAKNQIKYMLKAEVKKPAFQKKEITLTKGKSKALKIAYLPKAAKVTWKSSNKKVVTISKTGKVKAVRSGSSQITAVVKIKGKSYSLKQKVKVKKKPTLVIKVSNSFADKKNALMETMDESIVLKGKITGKNPLKKLSVSYTDYRNTAMKAEVTGGRSWETKIPLSIGTTEVKLIAEGKKKEKVVKTVFINRINKEITYSEQVKVAEKTEAEKVSEGVIKSFTDARNTVGTSDDEIVVLVKENSELLGKINRGELREGEAYVLPQTESFLAGFTGIYTRHQAPSEDSYSDSLYEEVIFKNPNLNQLFKEDISIDFSDGLDEENPVAFTLFGKSKKMNPKWSRDSLSQVRMVKAMSLGEVVAFGEEEKKEYYPRTGFQKEEFFNKLKEPAIHITSKQNEGKSLTIGWDDVVVYDHDGIKNEEDNHEGEISLSGEIGIQNLKHEGGVEWHKGSVLPEQLKNKTTFNIVGNLKLKGEAKEFSTAELVKTLNGDFENSIGGAGLKISGVKSFENKWVIGAIGLKLGTKTLVKGSIGDLASDSKLEPILMLFIYMDLDGNITVEGGLDFENKAAVTIGYNLQKNGFVGSYGTQEENKGIYHKDLEGYTFDLYKGIVPKRELSVQGEVKGNITLGIGAGAGLMVVGICPAVITGEVYSEHKVEAKLDGSIDLASKEWKGEGEITIRYEVGAKAEAEFRVLAEWDIDLFITKIEGEKEIAYAYKWPKFIFDKGEWSIGKKPKSEYFKPVKFADDKKGTKMYAKISKDLETVKIYGTNQTGHELNLGFGLKIGPVNIDYTFGDKRIIRRSDKKFAFTGKVYRVSTDLITYVEDYPDIAGNIDEEMKSVMGVTLYSDWLLFNYYGYAICSSIIDKERIDEFGRGMFLQQGEWRRNETGLDDSDYTKFLSKKQFEKISTRKIKLKKGDKIKLVTKEGVEVYPLSENRFNKSDKTKMKTNEKLKVSNLSWWDRVTKEHDRYDNYKAVRAISKSYVKEIKDEGEDFSMDAKYQFTDIKNNSVSQFFATLYINDEKIARIWLYDQIKDSNLDSYNKLPEPTKQKDWNILNYNAKDQTLTFKAFELFNLKKYLDRK